MTQDDTGPQEPDVNMGEEKAWFMRQDGTFNPAVLDKAVIAIPLLRDLEKEEEAIRVAANEGTQPRRKLFPVVINLNWDVARPEALERLRQLIAQAREGYSSANQLDENLTKFSTQYAFGSLEGPVIRRLVALDDQRNKPAVVPENLPIGTHRVIYSIWPDFEVRALLTKSVSTVKADAARAAFAAVGDSIVWAVLDSGIDSTHPHFARHQNCELPAALKDAAQNFTNDPGDAYQDDYGHGTHVAGIIAGEMSAGPATGQDGNTLGIKAFASQINENGQPENVQMRVSQIAGIAPRCKLLSIKVLNHKGETTASRIIVALEYIHQRNKFGRQVVIHGVNLSVGCLYEPEWFACGQSPLCETVNLLVRSGVVVVVAAGNTGYGWLQAMGKEAYTSGMDLSINDPGNAELAITVGSTHREKPHMYGVSYFSSKGPTGDGRLKPDLVAPGEKIISCGAGGKLRPKQKELERMGILRGEDGRFRDAESTEYGVYVEDSGTSMAAPHVSGAIAAFLSIRKEFIGKPEAVKEIFCATATDLKRERNFQGHGLVDLMRAIQSV